MKISGKRTGSRTTALESESTEEVTLKGKSLMKEAFRLVTEWKAVIWSLLSIFKFRGAVA